MTHHQLSLYADKLRKNFLGRRPTPYAVVILDDGTELGRTEVCEPTTAPDWCVCMKLEFEAAEKFGFKVQIFDEDSGDSADRKLAEADFEANEIFAAPGHMQMKEDSTGSQTGTARIYADLHKAIQGNSVGHISLQLRGLDMKNVEPGLLGLGRSDPFFEIAKKNVDHASGIVRWNSVYRSEHINDHLNPYWEEFRIGLEELCYCDLEWPLKVTVYDWEQSGKHRPIGEFEVTAEKLRERVAVKGNADREQAFELMLDEKAKLKGLVCVLKGEVTLDDAEEQAGGQTS